jgi:ABC-type polysaccharide/polyol phosphate transport system ATPase subunit
MNNDTVIKVENLSKKFCRSLKRSMFYGSVDVAKNMLGMKVNTGMLRKNEFWALQDINFEVKRGETFGLIGANGSGKTTLLRMINGIFPPDRGKMMIKGRIGALIAVGAGFHPHMTGRENIYLNGAILGMTQAEIRKNMDSIIDFAEIGDFLDAPVSTYSSGMYVRLGFAIAIHCKPDIVLVDEILAVGDSKFQRKCLDKIKEMRKSGTTFFLVSHNMQNIEAMCTQALLLDHGKQIMLGSPQEIVPTYELLLQNQNEKISKVNKIKDKTRIKSGLNLIFQYSNFGTNEVTVKKLEIIDKNNNSATELNWKNEIAVKAFLDVKNDLRNVFVWISFVYINDYDNDENNFVALASRKKINLTKGKTVLKFQFDKIHLATGNYKIGLFFFDYTFLNPYFQGYFGYITAKHHIPTMLRAGLSTPLCWANSTIEITDSNMDKSN